MEEEQTRNMTQQSEPLELWFALQRHLPRELVWTFVAAQDRRSRAVARPSAWRSREPDADEIELWRERAKSAEETEAFELSRLMERFKAKLAAGEVTGIVQDDPPFGPWRPIPPHGWRVMELVDLQRGDFRAGDRLLRSVHFVDSAPAPVVEVIPSGSPGRPTAETAV